MNMKLLFLAATALRVMIFAAGQSLGASEMPWVVVSKSKQGFVLEQSGKVFNPVGFNYDHDNSGRLLEDYWETEWPTVKAHFSQMKKMGAERGRDVWDRRDPDQPERQHRQHRSQPRREHGR